MIVDFAERAHNHNWDLDPVVRSLLDTDFYKLLMLQFIWKHFPTTQVSFTVSNRSSSVRLAEVVEREEISQQLEHVRSLRFLKSELIWLAGNTFSAAAVSSSPIFWSGWHMISAFPVTGLLCETDNSIWSSTGFGRGDDVGDLCPLHHQRAEVARRV